MLKLEESACLTRKKRSCVFMCSVQINTNIYFLLVIDVDVKIVLYFRVLKRRTS